MIWVSNAHGAHFVTAQPEPNCWLSSLWMAAHRKLILVTVTLGFGGSPYGQQLADAKPISLSGNVNVFDQLLQFSLVHSDSSNSSVQ